MFCTVLCSQPSLSFCLLSLFGKGAFCFVSIQFCLFFPQIVPFNFHSSQTFLSSLPGLSSWSQTQKAEITLPVCKEEKETANIPAVRLRLYEMGKLSAFHS